MPVAPAAARRLDPYKNFRFRLKWEGRPVAAATKVSTLKRGTEAVTHRPGGGRSPGFKTSGRVEHDAITLERGVTQDRDFAQWASRAGPRAAARRDLILELLDLAGKVAATYRLRRCWVSECQTQPNLDAHANGMAIVKLKLENEGCERIDGAG